VAEYDSEAGGAAVDALMAAITGEPLPQDAGAEAVAEHRAARADVELLREQLGIIGAALSEPEEPAAAAVKTLPVPTRKRRPRRPPGTPRERSRRPGARALALGTLVAAAVASVAVGMGWLIGQGGGGMGAGSGSADKAASSEGGGKSASLSAPGYVACARLIVEGTVTTVERVPGAAQDRITLDATHYYKPDKGRDKVTFLMDEAVAPRLHKGDHVLIGISRGSASPDMWATTEKDIARERVWITEALPKAARMKCTEQ